MLFPDARGDFCGYAIGTQSIEAPSVEWNGSDTYIQKTGINRDFGVFDSPDSLYAAHGSNLSGLRRLLFIWVVRHLMNATIGRIRTTPCDELFTDEALPSCEACRQ